MILLVAFVLSLVVALVRGGSLAHLGSLSLRYGWLALVVLAVQALEIYAPLPHAEGLLSPRSLVLLATYAALVGIVVANRALPGMIVIGTGLVLNLAAMVANGGYMPVTPEALSRAGLSGLALSQETGARLLATKDVLLPRAETRLWALSDILVIPPPLGTVLSAGDVLLALGIFWLLQKAMVQRAPAGAITVASTPT